VSERTSSSTERATILSVRNVTKQFETPAGSIDVLRGIDLDASSGDSIAIVGASGSGKSTLLSLLAGLDLPTSGASRSRDAISRA